VIFRWDPRKAAGNLKKHAVDFREAATVFNDPLSVTFPDADHSEREQLFLTIGQSLKCARLLSLIPKTVITFESSAPDLPPGESKASMKKTKLINGIRREYDFAAMKGGVRGKYAKQYREGTNIVLLEADIAQTFPNDEAVNQALRGVLNTTRAVRGTGGLADKSIQPVGLRRTRKPRRA
jgi:uncharacterized DUF497 family protein